MNPVFSALTESQLRTVEDVLSNDETSTDEELLEFFIEEGIPVTPARQAVSLRDDYLTRIFEEGYTPIRAGENARFYDPQSRQFKRA
ncbi:hypothetical protein R5R73_02040 [Salinicola sp. LHM]|uniref:hypothetical protein n=1 Tax=Halomonadaceae TaxID=28256 RepID=UPI00054FA22C|nr:MULTISPECIES: hypothetical protein [Halomonadaceae]MDF9434622.1 hypothetical protein [Chromohalobacter israelensis]WQH33493.1 hypothetical protein R5R73_02040 [Salinicola sp. LHM]